MGAGKCQWAIVPVSPELLLAIAALLAAMALLAGCGMDEKGEKMGDASRDLDGIRVEVPDGCGCRSEEVAFEVANGEEVRYATLVVEFPEDGADVYVIADAGEYLDYALQRRWGDYVEWSASLDSNSSWGVSLGNAEGTALVQGSPEWGGEYSGDVYARRGARMVWMHVKPRAGGDGFPYSEFMGSGRFSALVGGVRFPEA